MNPIYLGAFIDKEGKISLEKGAYRCQRQARSRFGAWKLYSYQYIPHDWSLYADHLTMQFRPTDLQLKEFLPFVGHDVSLVCSHIINDDKCLAVLVSNIVSPVTAHHLLFDKIKHPHVTVACHNSVVPKYSKGLAEQYKAPGALSPVVKVRARLGVFDGETGKPYFGEDNV